jgi:GTP-binding protein Era
MRKSLNVAVFGAPNSGKSTFANAIVNAEICIVSSKPHTTREPTMAIFTHGNTQVVFIDTPGINTKMSKDESILSSMAQKCVHGSDICLFIFDGSKKIPPNIVAFADNLDKPKVALINKIDLISKGRLLPATEILKNTFQDIFYCSIIKQQGLELIRQFLLDKATEKEWLFESSAKGTRELNKLIEDRTQEAIFEIMSDEVPYKTKVQTIGFREEKSQIIIDQIIHIGSGHRHIFLGHIKKLSMLARFKISKMFDKSVHLFIDIK